MIFEHALQEMRKGKKIRHPSFAPDEYLIACHVGFKGDNTPFNELPMSVAKIKGDRQHNDMAGISNYIAKVKRQLKVILTDDEYKKYHNLHTEMYIAQAFREDIFKYPQLNLFLIMRDDWEVID